MTIQPTVRRSRRGRSWTSARVLLLIVVAGSSLLINAWWHIQAVRLSYKASQLQAALSELRAESETFHQELARLSSLPRLEEWAKAQKKVRPSGPAQLVLLHD